MSSSSSSSDEREEKSGEADLTPVYLSVYDLTPVNNYTYWFGIGIFHSGIEGMFILLLFKFFALFDNLIEFTTQPFVYPANTQYLSMLSNIICKGFKEGQQNLAVFNVLGQVVL